MHAEIKNINESLINSLGCILIDPNCKDNLAPYSTVPVRSTRISPTIPIHKKITDKAFILVNFFKIHIAIKPTTTDTKAKIYCLIALGILRRSSSIKLKDKSIITFAISAGADTEVNRLKKKEKTKNKSN